MAIRFDVVMTPGELAGRRFTGSTAVVIDLLRATSTIVNALVNGCLRIFPVDSIDEAFSLRDSLAPDNLLLGGERRGLRIDGFEFGNSPREYTSDAVAGRSIALTTTNGTLAIRATKAADELLTCALGNLTAVASRILANGRDVSIVCAGRSGRVSLEDAVCAGRLIQRVAELGHEGTKFELDDGAQIASILATRWPDPIDALYSSDHGRYLVEIGLADDLKWCGVVDRYDAVVAYHDGYLSLLEG